MSDVKEVFFCNFEKALASMKSGRKVTRMDWNYGSKSSHTPFVSLCPGVGTLASDKFWNPHNRKFAESIGGARVRPYFSEVNCLGSVSMGWVPTAADILAEDWLILAD